MDLIVSVPECSYLLCKTTFKNKLVCDIDPAVLDTSMLHKIKVYETTNHETKYKIVIFIEKWQW